MLFIRVLVTGIVWVPLSMLSFVCGRFGMSGIASTLSNAAGKISGLDKADNIFG